MFFGSFRIFFFRITRESEYLIYLLREARIFFPEFNTRLYDKKTLNHIITEHQSGFQLKDSTVNQLVYIYITIISNLDIGKDIMFIFCDISKAFDRVWHTGHLYKLRKIGIDGNLLSWVTDYLDDRKQKVVLDGFSSGWEGIDAGVPKGQCWNLSCSLYT